MTQPNPPTWWIGLSQVDFGRFASSLHTPVYEFKTKIDVVAFEDTNEASNRVVICNDKGEVLVAMSGKISLPSSVVMVEVMAARRAVQFVVEIGSSHSIFEGD